MSSQLAQRAAPLCHHTRRMKTPLPALFRALVYAERCCSRDAVTNRHTTLRHTEEDPPVVGKCNLTPAPSLPPPEFFDGFGTCCV